MKIRKVKEVGSISYDTLKEAKEQIEKWIKTYGEDATLIVDVKWECAEFSIEYMAEETEAEKKVRLRQEKQVLDAERKRYEELKKKFEGKSS